MLSITCSRWACCSFRRMYSSSSCKFWSSSLMCRFFIFSVLWASLSLAQQSLALQLGTRSLAARPSHRLSLLLVLSFFTWLIYSCLVMHWLNSLLISETSKSLKVAVQAWPHAGSILIEPSELQTLFHKVSTCFIQFQILHLVRHLSFSFSTDVVKFVMVPITCCTRTTNGFLHLWVSDVLFSIHIIIAVWMHLVPFEALYWFITLFFIYDIVISTVPWYIGRISCHWIKLMLYLLKLALAAFGTFRWLFLRIFFSSYSFDYMLWHYLHSFEFNKKLILSTLMEKFKENSSFDGLSWSIIGVLLIKSDEHVAGTLVMACIVDL